MAKRGVAPFLQKLSTILENPSYHHLISFNHSGELVSLHDLKTFCARVLPVYFKHAHFTSFLRQLNMYGFSTVEKNANVRVFHNPLFCRGRPDLLPQIKRQNQSGGSGSKRGKKRRPKKRKRLNSSPSTSEFEVPTPLAAMAPKSVRVRFGGKLVAPLHVKMLHEEIGLKVHSLRLEQQIVVAEVQRLRNELRDCHSLFGALREAITANPSASVQVKKMLELTCPAFLEAQRIPRAASPAKSRPIVDENAFANFLRSPTSSDMEVVAILDVGSPTRIGAVLDPAVNRVVRPHQVSAIRFLYRCITGADGPPHGCILADAMGLGKTLTTIGLLWTLMKQGPRGLPFSPKAIVVTPSSLLDNWEREFIKWLGRARIGVAVAHGNSATAEPIINDFVMSSASNMRVLVISYEMFRIQFDAIVKGARQARVIVCDEGHRLKNTSGNQTIDALMRYPCQSRIVLSGTPVQNNLQEFYAMTSFVYPGVLGDLPEYNRHYIGPINRSKEPGATDEEIELGTQRSGELTMLTRSFMLRRTMGTVDGMNLPPQVELHVFCRMSPLQVELYSWLMNARGKTEGSSVLQLLTALRKVCIHPFLCLFQKGQLQKLADDFEISDSSGPLVKELSSTKLPFADAIVSGEDMPESPEWGQTFFLSGKLQVLRSLLLKIRPTGDRCVVVSNFTTTLDIVEEILRREETAFLRLDGSVSSDKRNRLVQNFNDPTFRGAEVFLLTATSGGVGLNLIGGNRLILLDPHWNPAVDDQVIARVRREGQKKNVFVYRLFCSGSLEEVILQRQQTKHRLLGHVVAGGGKSDTDSLTAKALLEWTRPSGASESAGRCTVPEDPILDAVCGECEAVARVGNDEPEVVEEPLDKATAPSKEMWDAFE